MLDYALHDSSKIGPLRSLIGLPLVLISLFCFSFLIMQAHHIASLQPTADSRPASRTTHTQSTLAEPSLSESTPASLAPAAPQTQSADATPLAAAASSLTVAPTASASLDTASTQKVQPSTLSSSTLQSAAQKQTTNGTKTTNKNKVSLPNMVTKLTNGLKL